MIARGISLEEVKNAIMRGSKRVQGGKIVAAYRYFEAVCKKVDEIFVVVTVLPRW
jgi:putative sterol carrier protein